MSTSSTAYSPDLVRAYLQEIGRVRLLTAEEELRYGRQVQRLMTLLDIQAELRDRLGHEPSKEEWAAAVELDLEDLDRQVEQGQRAKRKMIEANLRLVVSIAKKYQKRHMEFLDLIQEGTLGLERGVEKFDPSKGYKFSTYAYWWIRQAITRAIAQQSRTIRLPIHITEKLNKLKKTQRELSQQLGRSATASELAEVLELPLEQVREYIQMNRQPVSLDVKVGDSQDTELQELLEDEQSSPSDYVEQESLRRDLRTLMAELTPQQQAVIALRYGLDEGDSLSLAKVGERLNISRERVRKLERQAMDHLRRRSRLLAEYAAS
ncbi:RpoD/SigA family RNA polymerase sigma factor [Synechococcus elongatus]|uniref:Circadian expression RNA polymerase sigma factor SigA2 n=2 Tax=Synechococcus elongatus TaxID=32046 RepID=A0AAN1UV35_SYNEL|nr:RpoD/SigA family RNA polymerase sigma factor [Synechococcus elongatus]AZB73196.1 RNA polymerase sigma factor, RpoD/SigA family [Synechococcus elongatus PCC 11801]QFZ92357.1 RpoD/SigA family RNA polymerase sigma factor [Synechococcus elongatus PCC 11802]